MRVEIRFEWHDVGEVSLDIQGQLRFPPLPREPAVYRFRLVGASTSNYIGEAIDLRRRANGYRTGHPRQRTNHRMNKRMREHLETGGRVEVAIAVEVEAVVNGRARTLDLHSKASRILAESAALHLVPDAEPLENLPGLGEPSKSSGWQQGMPGLAAFLPIFSAPDFRFGEWVPPEPQEEGVISLGYFIFSAQASSFIQETYDLGLIRTDLDWTSWHRTPEGHALISDPRRVAIASAEELANVLTALARKDRFAEGALDRAWKSGVLLAVVRRAAELAAEVRWTSPRR